MLQCSSSQAATNLLFKVLFWQAATVAVTFYDLRNYLLSNMILRGKNEKSRNEDGKKEQGSQWPNMSIERS